MTPPLVNSLNRVVLTQSTSKRIKITPFWSKTNSGKITLHEGVILTPPELELFQLSKILCVSARLRI